MAILASIGVFFELYYELILALLAAIAGVIMFTRKSKLLTQMQVSIYCMACLLVIVCFHFWSFRRIVLENTSNQTVKYLGVNTGVWDPINGGSYSRCPYFENFPPYCEVQYRIRSLTALSEVWVQGNLDGKTDLSVDKNYSDAELGSGFRVKIETGGHVQILPL